MKLVFKGRNRKLIAAVRSANEILQMPEFYKQIAAKGKFDNSDIPAAEIAQLIQNFPADVTVLTWWNKLSTANARTNNAKFIEINKAKLRRAKKSIVNTLIHELVHAIDFANGGLDFTHVDNSNDNGEEDNTAPWFIGKIAEDLVNN